jgi:hypothetical protein
VWVVAARTAVLSVITGGGKWVTLSAAYFHRSGWAVFGLRAKIKLNANDLSAISLEQCSA